MNFRCADVVRSPNKRLSNWTWRAYTRRASRAGARSGVFEAGGDVDARADAPSNRTAFSVKAHDPLHGRPVVVGVDAGQ